MDVSGQSAAAEVFQELEGAAPVLAPTAAGDSFSKPQDLAALHDIPVTVEAVLGGARMRIDQLLEIGAGSVIELDRRVGEPVDVMVNGRLIARGELVLIDGALGVTLTEIVREDG